MNNNSHPLTNEEIIELFNSKKLMGYIFSHDDFDRKRAGARQYADLHNAGKINLLSLVREPEFETVELTSFFGGQHFYCAVIPDLQSSPDDMMACVEALVNKGGTDLAANEPNAAFRTWCSRDLSRARTVIDLARNNDAQALKFLTFALEAGQYFDDALRMIEASPLTQLSAMTSLSRMKLTEADATNALDSFLNVSKSSGDDLTLANVLNAAFHLVQNANGVGGERLLQIVENVCRKPGPQVNYSTARALWLHTPLITNELLTAMAGTLQLVDPTHKVTLGEIDSGLRHLLDTALADKGIELLRLILIRNPDTVTIAEFDSFGHKLLGKHDGTFERVIVAWLLSGEKSLCQALDQLLAKAPGDDRSITLTAEQLSELRQTEKLFLCRKAIGYFFLHPVFAASIIASILRVCSEEDAGVFRDLLVDPLLRNYGGELRDYLSKVKEDDLAYRATQIALSEADRYLTDVRSVGEVDELKPTERERQAAHRKDADEVRRTHKAAMAQSVLLSMVRRSVVLYGKRTVTYVANPDGNRRPIEMDLKPHSFGWEIPRTSVIDPVGLDYMLRVFRNERIR